MQCVLGASHTHADSKQTEPGNVSGQAMPQEPQFPGSETRSVQTPEQSVGRSGGHLQTPLSQKPPSGQRFPQEPQFATSPLRKVSHPFVMSLSQFPKPD